MSPHDARLINDVLQCHSRDLPIHEMALGTATEEPEWLKPETYAAALEEE